MAVVRSDRISPEQAEKVRVVARRLYREMFGQNATAFGKAIGMSQPNARRLLHEKQGMAKDTALKILSLGGENPEEIGLDAPVSDVFPTKPVVSRLPGWLTAETEARQIYKRVSEAGWLAARKFSTHLSPAQVTPDFVMHLALAAEALGTVSDAEVLATAEAAETAAREDAARRARK